jgi:hypothetical protein
MLAKPASTGDTALGPPPRWVPRETRMSKDKAGRASKTVATKTAKEKKQAKRDKKAAKATSAKDL